MRFLIGAMLVVTGIIHVLPLAGVLGADRLSALYGLSFDEPSLAVLMRHRAVLFGLLGAFLIGAAFHPGVQGLALLAGFVSVTAFLALAWITPGTNAAIHRVVLADRIALACLVVALVAWLMQRRGAP